MSIVIWCSSRSFVDANNEAASRASARRVAAARAVPAIGCERTMSPARDTSSSGLAPTNPSTLYRWQPGYVVRRRSSTVARSNATSAVTTTSRASATLRNDPSAIAFVACSTSSHHDSGDRLGSTVNRDGDSRRNRGRFPAPIASSSADHGVPAGAVVGSTEHLRGHDHLGGCVGSNGSAPNATGPQPGKPDLVVDLDGRERGVGLGQRNPQGHAAPGEPEAIALEQQVADREQIDVGVEPAGGGLHVRVPVMSCAMPPVSTARCTSWKPAALTMSSSFSVSGRVGDRLRQVAIRRAVGEQRADARHDVTEVHRVTPAQERFVGVATSSSAMRPPGRTTRASDRRGTARGRRSCAARTRMWRRRPMRRAATAAARPPAPAVLSCVRPRASRTRDRCRPVGSRPWPARHRGRPCRMRDRRRRHPGRDRVTARFAAASRRPCERS